MSKKSKEKMKNITINFPNCYDDNIQKLIKMKLVPNRSEAIRIAISEFLNREKNNLKLLEFNGKILRENSSLSSKPKI